MTSAETGHPEFHASHLLSPNDTEVDHAVLEVTPADRTNAVNINLQSLAGPPEPEPPFQPSAMPNQKKRQANDDGGELESPDAQTNQDTGLGPESRATRPRRSPEYERDGASGSKPAPETAQKPSDSPNTGNRKPPSTVGGPEPSPDRPPLRRSARIAALRERAIAAAKGTTAQQATKTPPKKSSKPTSARGKKKRAEKVDSPKKPQRKRRGGGK